jgi:hypothetical protein
MSQKTNSSARRRWTLAAVAVLIATIIALLLLRSCKPTPPPPPPPPPPVQITPFSIVQPQARFKFQWLQDNKPTEQLNRILSLDDGLYYQWRVLVNVFPVAGTRRVQPAALENATRHNPWYRACDSAQDSATSFIFSRKVYRAIKAGQPIDLTMEDRFPPKADPAATRPVDFTATLTPTGPDTIAPTVNGRPETLPVLRCTLHGQPMAILDDPAYPVALAQALQSVTTDIRCRLVDPQDAPLPNAHIAILPDPHTVTPTSAAPIPARAPTASDGLFALPPPDQTDTYGKVTLQITFPDQSTRNATVDLSAPGLSIVPVKIQPPHTPATDPNPPPPTTSEDHHAP